MMGFLRSYFRSFLAFALILSLSACSSVGTAGLEPFTSPDGRYGFLYPTGWTKVAVNSGPEVVFHDLINSDETLSLVISEVGNDIDLEDLGGADEVGKRFIKEVGFTDEAGKQVNLIQATERNASGHVFYDLEYSVNLPQVNRHEFATVSIDRGYLYTLAASSSEKRWKTVSNLYEKVVTSFTFLL